MTRQRYMIRKRKMQDTAYTRVTILRVTGKKIFHNTDQNPKLEE